MPAVTTRCAQPGTDDGNPLGRDRPWSVVVESGIGTLISFSEAWQRGVRWSRSQLAVHRRATAAHRRTGPGSLAPAHQCPERRHRLHSQPAGPVGGSRPAGTILFRRAGSRTDGYRGELDNAGAFSSVKPPAMPPKQGHRRVVAAKPCRRSTKRPPTPPAVATPSRERFTGPRPPRSLSRQRK